MTTQVVQSGRQDLENTKQPRVEMKTLDLGPLGVFPIRCVAIQMPRQCRKTLRRVAEQFVEASKKG